MNKCIYSLLQNENFKKQEHVFPAFLGGKKCLDKGVVSDESNELFSKMEAQVSHFSGISALRDLYGPGKRGKLKFEGKPLLANYDGNPSFFVSMSNNRLNVINQIIITFTGLRYKVHFGLKENNDPRESLKQGIEFKNMFMSIKKTDRYVYIEDPLGLDNRYVVTFYKGKWYLSSRSRIDIFKLMYKIKTGKPYNGDFMNSEVIKVKEGISLSRVANDTVDTYRVYAKTIFNTLCFLYGQDFCLDKKFNIIRKYVYNGLNNDQLQCNLNHMIDFKTIIHESDFDNQSHIVMLSENYLGINGVISFYGGAYVFALNITRIVQTKESLKFFVVDWKNNVEKVIHVESDSIDKYLIPHEVASKEEILNTSSIFGRKIPIDLVPLIEETLSIFFNKEIIVAFESKDDNYSKVGYIKELDTYYIHLDNKLDNQTFFATLLQSITYIKHVNKSKGYAQSINNERGEEIVKNYINYLCTFSVVSKYVLEIGYNLDVIYDKRFSSFVTNYLKNIKKGKLNDFLVVRNILESCVLISYDYKYQSTIAKMFGDSFNQFQKKIELILDIVEGTTLSSLCDRTKNISKVINILGIENHVAVTDK